MTICGRSSRFTMFCNHVVQRRMDKVCDNLRKRHRLLYGRYLPLVNYTISEFDMSLL